MDSEKRPGNTSNIFVQLVAQQMLPRCKCEYCHLRAQHFYAAERRRRFSFLQHENSLHAEVAIPATNNLNLPQRGNMSLGNIASVMSVDTKMKGFVSGRANWGKIPEVGRI